MRRATTALRVRATPLRADVAVRVWSPGQGALPLLVVHDGPAYERHARLTRWARSKISEGELPPFRIALLDPGEREEWYSASALYARALVEHVLPALGASGPPVGVGASLGALALLHAEVRAPGSFGALFLQSGSYFVPRHDRHESGFGRYGRIVRFVRTVRRVGRPAGAAETELTCGAEEENVQNNRVIARALGAPLHEVAGGHDWVAWRDAFDPFLVPLLARLWSR
jgi:enterochelin esterase-like enzyme